MTHYSESLEVTTNSVEGCRGSRPKPMRCAPAGAISALLLLAACGGGSAVENPAAKQTGAAVYAMQLLTLDEGWALTQDDLSFTQDGGSTWSVITPGGISANNIEDVFFLDSRYGWVAASVGSSDAARAAISLFSTSDGGRTWLARGPIPTASLTGISTASIDFIDPQNGWVMVKAATNANFSIGELFRTSDGGVSWTSLAIPIGGPINFVTISEGWTAGGPAGDQLHVTHDGGNSWQRQTITPPAGFEASNPTYQVPELTNSQELVLSVGFGGPTSGIAFYSSDDSGKSWALRGIVASAQELGIPAAFSADIVDSRVWALANGTRILTTADAGASWRETAIRGNSGEAPDSVAAVDFTSAETGWALTSTGLCPSGLKLGCTIVSQLLTTSDAGQTWTVRTP